MITGWEKEGKGEHFRQWKEYTRNSQEGRKFRTLQLRDEWREGPGGWSITKAGKNGFMKGSWRVLQ